MWTLIAASFAAVAVGTVVTCAVRAISKKSPPPPPPYPGRRTTFPAAPPPGPPLSAPAIAAQTQATADIALPHTDPNSVWDQGTIAPATPLRTALDNFAAGTTGASVKALNIAAYAGNPQALHDHLVANGFQHRREALKDKTDATTTPPTQLYWTTTMGTTANPADPATVPHDIYTHNDGGIVRVKPEGVPDPNPCPRPQPHAVKAVLYTPHQDNGFDDEAFKVTNAGQAVPKIFSSQGGMRQARPPISKSQVKGAYIDKVMMEGHTDI